MQDKINILYEDAHIIVVHKPVGLAVQSAGIGQPDLVSELKKYLAEKSEKNPYLGVVHRLDQPVEGVLVFAKNAKAAGELSRQLQSEAFGKEYLAVACGKPAKVQAELVDYLEKENGMAVITTMGKGKKAVLTYELQAERVLEEQQISLLHITLQTGRFHQIRIQLSHAGCPLLGDKKYGTQSSLALSEMLQVRNVALCAKTLTFMHPVTKKKLEYTVKPTNPAFDLFVK